jgi:hypothetical protein
VTSEPRIVYRGPSEGRGPDPGFPVLGRRLGGGSLSEGIFPPLPLTPFPDIPVPDDPAGIELAGPFDAVPPVGSPVPELPPLLEAAADEPSLPPTGTSPICEPLPVGVVGVVAEEVADVSFLAPSALEAPVHPVAAAPATIAATSSRYRAVLMRLGSSMKRIALGPTMITESSGTEGR